MPDLSQSPNPGPWPFRSGYFYDSGSTVLADSTYTTLAMLATRIYATPLLVPNGSFIDQLRLNVTIAAAAGKLLKLMLYSAGSDGLPALPLETSTDFAADATGVKTFTLASPRTGRLFACAWSDGAPTVTALSVSQVLRVFGEPTFATRSLIVGAFRDLAYGASPSPFAAGGNVTGTIPVVGARAV